MFEWELLSSWSRRSILRIMRLSARNQLRGTVKSINEGAVNSEVVIEVAPGVELTAIITKASVQNLGLAVDAPAYAVIKASNVMVAAE